MRKRFCTNCGNELSQGDKFCAACGMKVPQLRKATAAPEPAVPTAVSAVTVPLNTPVPNPQPTEENILSKAFRAFVEMWFFIVMTVKADSAEEKRACRREAKKRMLRTPILALACPITTISLCVWSHIQVSETRNTFFVYTMIAFALISFFLVFFFLCIFFTKLTKEDEAAPLTMPAKPKDTNACPEIPGLITWSIRIVVWLIALALIGVMSIPAIKFISKKANEIVSH